MGDPVVYFEILGGDGRAQQEFYARLFGWSVTPVGSTGGGYATVEGAGLAGAVGAFERGPAYVTVYVASDDPEATLARAVELGGEVFMPAREVAPGIVVGLFRDPAGNMVGVMRREAS